MSGFGLFSAGTGPFGLWSPDEAPAQATGSVGSRWIDPATRDYAVNPGTSNLLQMPSVRQQVLLALMTVELSAATAPRFGVSVSSKMDNKFENQTKDSCRIALRHLTEPDPPVIRINNITVTKGRNSRAGILVDYTDLSTGERDTAEV